MKNNQVLKIIAIVLTFILIIVIVLIISKKGKTDSDIEKDNKPSEVASFLEDYQIKCQKHDTEDETKASYFVKNIKIDGDVALKLLDTYRVEYDVKSEYEKDKVKAEYKDAYKDDEALVIEYKLSDEVNFTKGEDGNTASTSVDEVLALMDSIEFTCQR